MREIIQMFEDWIVSGEKQIEQIRRDIDACRASISDLNTQLIRRTARINDYRKVIKILKEHPDADI